MNLLQLQRAFWNHVAGRESDAAGSVISGMIGGDPSRGLRVYRNAHRLRFAEALRDTFEKIALRLGDEAFCDLAADYAKSRPSQSWTLADFGDGFSALLQGRFPDRPEIGELASLEWAMRRAFDGPEAAPLDAASIEGIDWDGAVFSFVPTLRLIPSSTNCGAVWAALAAGEAPPPVVFLEEVGALCIWRKGLTPTFRSVGARECLALRTAFCGVSFGLLCRLMAQPNRSERENAEEVGAMLARWFQDEMLTAISPGPDDAFDRRQPAEALA